MNFFFKKKIIKKELFKNFIIFSLALLLKNWLRHYSIEKHFGVLVLQKTRSRYKNISLLTKHLYN